MKARLPKTPWFVCLLTAAGLILASAQQVEYKPVQLGGKLELVPNPKSLTETLTGILWKHGPNKVAEWDKVLGPAVDYYGTYKKRTELNKVTGKLVVDNMTIENGGEYSVTVNGRVQSQTYQVELCKDVPKPKLDVKPLVCGASSADCTLVCEGGDITLSCKVTYRWKKDAAEWTKPSEFNQMKIFKTTDSKFEKIICEIGNKFSSHQSDPKDNPLYHKEPAGSNGGIIAGILVALAIIGGGVGVGWWKRDVLKKKWESRKSPGTPSMDPPPAAASTQSDHGEEQQQPLIDGDASKKTTTNTTEGPGPTDETYANIDETKGGAIREGNGEVDGPEKNSPPAAASTQSDHGDASKKTTTNTTEGPGATDKTYANIDETKGNPQASEATTGASNL